MSGDSRRSPFLCYLAPPSDPREFMLTFAAGAGLRLFLEIWGTTRACWNYYTLETPPPFAILAHGMAAVAFVRRLEVVRGRGKCGACPYQSETKGRDGDDERPLNRNDSDLAIHLLAEFR